MKGDTVMDENLLLWIVVNGCAIIGLVIFIPMATIESGWWVRKLLTRLKKENQIEHE